MEKTLCVEIKGDGVETGCQRSSLSTEHRTTSYTDRYSVNSWPLHMCTSSRASEFTDLEGRPTGALKGFLH